MLGDILVRSAHPNAHTVRVELERNGELVHEKTVEVDDSAVERIPATWQSTPAVYTLRYVVSGPNEHLDLYTRMLTAEDAYDGYDCYIVAITMGFPDDDPPYVDVGTPENMSSGDCPD